MRAVLPRVADLLTARRFRTPDPREIDTRLMALSSASKAAYGEMLPQLRRGATSVSVRAPCTEDEAREAYLALVLDHPEFFWLNEQGRIGCGTKVGGGGITVEPRHSLATVERDQAWRSVCGSIRNIHLSAPAGAGSYDLARYAYEWVCENVTYDLTAPRGQTAAGALADRRAVCAGIADAYCLILRTMGIPCGCVSGYDEHGDGHRWNIVCIDGEYSFVDCTNGRLAGGYDIYCAQRPSLTYRYLCFSTPEALRRYSFDKGQLVPPCLSRSHDWFAMNGLTLGPVFVMEQMDSFLSSAYACGKRAVEVKFVGSRAYRDGVRATANGGILQGRFGRLLASKRTGEVSMTYYRDDGMRTVAIGW